MTGSREAHQRQEASDREEGEDFSSFTSPARLPPAGDWSAVSFSGSVSSATSHTRRSGDGWMIAGLSDVREQ